MGGHGFVDEGRALVAVEGADRVAFLQGLVTSDAGRIAEGRAVWAALLTPQGKYLFDFLMLARGETILLDVAAPRAAALAQRLAMYRLRRAVTVAPAPGLGVALLWDAEPAPMPEGAFAVPDPRHASLGWRLYGPDPAALLAGAAPARPEDHAARRVAAGVPDAGTELVPDESYILEHGFAELGGVDFRKGCYVGQEVTARMRHKTDLKKRLVRVALDGAAETGAEIVTAEGKPAGRLGTVAGGEALAHLRLDRAGGDLHAGAATLRVIGEA